MINAKYDTTIKSNKNIITAIISLAITYILYKNKGNNKGKKRYKKPFKIFSKTFNFISELWTSFALKKKKEKICEDTFPIKMEEAEIIHL